MDLFNHAFCEVMMESASGRIFSFPIDTTSRRLDGKPLQPMG
jgi:hypothetical protein